MKPIEQRRAAAKFAKYWAKKKGNEKKETQKFWNDLLENVYGVKGVRDFIFYEDDVKVSGATKWIDAKIPSTKVYIEQKSKGISLDKKIRQSGDIYLTPYEQALRYANSQTNQKRPDWIVTCNFEEFHIHNLNSENMEQYETVRLCDLEEEFGRMKFLQDIKDTNTYKEVQVSRQAGELKSMTSYWNNTGRILQNTNFTSSISFACGLCSVYMRKMPTYSTTTRS